MRTVKLASITLRNFAGVTDFTLDPNGKSITVAGTNGTGKTTLADAYYWLLFNRDSLGRTAFDVATLQPDGTPDPVGEHSVTGVLLVNDRQVTLEKTLKQKFVKPRGAAEPRFAGYETSYKMNGVPLSQTEYRSRIDDIIPSGTWSLLSHATAFNNLHWQERRKLLLSIAGNAGQLDGSIDADLLAELESRTPDEHRKMLTEQRKTLSGELKAIAVRISEASRDATGGSLAEADAAVNTAKAELQNITNRAAEAEENSPAMRLLKEIHELELADAETNAEAERQAFTAAREYRQKLLELQATLSDLENTVNTETTAAKKLDAEVERLRKAWATTRAGPIDSGTCHACNQPLPNGETVRAAELKRISEAGAAAAEQAAATKARAADAAARAEEVKEQIAGLRQPAAVPAATPNPRIQELKNELMRIEADEADAFPAKVAAAQEKLNTAMREQAAAAVTANAQSRVAELREEQTRYSEQLEQVERSLYRLEKLARAQAEKLEAEVNDMFPTVKFKLFNELVNGNLEETCEATLNGVPFNSLNTAAQVQAGMEIINVLQAHEKFIAPIIVDGRESILTLPDTPAQVISLTVSAEHDKLTAVIEGEAA